MGARRFEDLDVWQLAHWLEEEVFAFTTKAPAAHDYRYCDQIRESVRSAPRNIAEGFGRYYKQSKANFYSDNAQSETTYVSRNRQLGTFDSIGLGAKLTYSAGRYKGEYDIKVNGALEAYRFNYKDFTDVRDGSKYSFIGSLFQVYVTATY